MTASAPPERFTRVLRLDPSVHTAPIKRADVDRDGRWLVTGSHDRTVRVWSADTGALTRTIPIPTGPGAIGSIYAVAISPDGGTIAAGGWTRTGNQQVYLFDRASGDMLRRIDGLPSVVIHLAFSPDGARLLAALGVGGIRLFDPKTGAEIARDADYGGASYGAAFAPDGRFATTAYDGDLRLYDRDGGLLDRAPSGHERPFGVAVHPDGDRIAVGFGDAATVRVLSLEDDRLRPLFDADTTGVTNGNLGNVAWSRDGGRLFAGGTYNEDGIYPVLAWEAAGRGARRSLAAGRNTLMSILPLAGGDLLAAAQDPWLGRLDPAGAPRWAKPPAQADFRGLQATLTLSHDGTRVGFGYRIWGAEPAVFDVAALRLEAGAGEGLSPPDQARLAVTDWEDTVAPKLDGAPLPLERHEMSRSLAIHPDGARFVLGTEWYLRAFAADGAELWRRAVPGVVWAVTISGDGRYVVAAHGDGTIRWHRMDNGAELLAFFPHADRTHWIAWEPETGVYAASPGAYAMLRWQIDRGWDETPRVVRAAGIPQTRRPAVIRALLAQGGLDAALAAVERAKIATAVERAVAGDPKGRLHVLAIGISDPGPQAPHLRLKWAAQDAEDICAELENTQDALYRETLAQCLTDGDATRRGLLQALAAMQASMAPGDAAVIHFSGHGAMFGDEVWLVPHGLQEVGEIGTRDGGLPVAELRGAVERLAQRGHVLLTLDCCHAGGVHGTGSHGLDARSLRVALAQANVAVLTGCRAEEKAIERDAWRNGAFTEALLWALAHGDLDGDGLLGVVDLIHATESRLAALTEGRQRLGVENRFTGDLLVATGV